VEHHLRMAYRKLGVRSRTEMTGLLGGDVDITGSSPA
jgi:hypothetical protein